MSRILRFGKRQRVCRVNLVLLRRITLHLLDKYLKVSGFELAIQLVASPEMTRMNEAFMQHAGSTDVITFDHFDLLQTTNRGKVHNAGVQNYFGPSCGGGGRHLHGELFICLDEALAQSRRFRTTWQSELVRYVIHGLLHLCDYRDLQPAARRRMKREEDRLLRALAKEFAFPQLGS